MEIQLSEEFEVVCNQCGKKLSAELWQGEIVVDPCQDCLDNEYEKGESDAKKD